MKNFRKAFSLIELILIVIIVGLVGAVCVPTMVKIRKIARENAIEMNVKDIISAGKRYNIEKDTKSVDYKTLVESKYIKECKSVGGESYDAIRIENAGGKIVVDNPFGDKIEKEY
ncbi:MAG: hypothetical protein E7036_07525 [Opitutales bacterium]|nr:hypothetical protein [Opitutales bacterium]